MDMLKTIELYILCTWFVLNVNYILVARQQSVGSLKLQAQLSDFTLTFHFHALEKGMATHSSILA